MGLTNVGYDFLRVFSILPKQARFQRHWKKFLATNQAWSSLASANCCPWDFLAGLGLTVAGANIRFDKNSFIDINRFRATSSLGVVALVPPNPGRIACWQWHDLSKSRNHVCPLPWILTKEHSKDLARCVKATYLHKASGRGYEVQNAGALSAQNVKDMWSWSVWAHPIRTDHSQLWWLFPNMSGAHHGVSSQ